MKNRFHAAARRIDPGLALALLLGITAAWPFLVRPSLPRETDAELHVFRAAELGYSLRAFDLYPRWAPDFYYGYGYPIFNYYAPLTYFLANVLSLAVPNGAVFGVKAVFVLGFLLAAAGAYGLGSLHTGPRGGLIAAVSFLFAPYFYLIDSHLRGDLAEFFALALAPAVFWAVALNHESRSRLSLTLASILPAALILSHNLLSLVFFAMLVIYAGWIGLVEPLSGRTRRLLWNLIPLGLAVGLAAFFWLPVAAESTEVQLHNLIGPGHFDYKEHFLGITELFAPSVPLDLGSVNPAFRFNFGVGQWILGALGLAGLVTVLRRYHRSGSAERTSSESPEPRAGLFWPASAGIMIFMMVEVSAAFWESIPIMAFFQFPWRLLGPASLALAVTGAFAERLFTRPSISPRCQQLLLAAALSMPILATAPILIPPAWDNFGPTDLNAMLDFELNGLALGTTSTGDFVPSTVDVVPGPNDGVVASYRAGGPIDRVNRQTLPEGAEVELLRQRPTAETYRVYADQPFVLRLYRFMFAGWRATVDGERVDIQVAKPEGFITILVPAGEHIVDVWLALTLPRAVASAVSVMSLLVLIILIRQTRVGASPQVRPMPIGRPTWLGVGVALIVVGLGASLGWWQPRSAGGVAEPASVRVQHHLEGGVDLIGFDVDRQEVFPGESIPIILYWKAREPVPANYQVFVHLTTVPQHTWAQSDKLNPGDYPTTRWPLDRYVRDPHSLTIPAGTPPGAYTIRIGLWNHGTGQRQLVLEPDGTILGDSIGLPVQIEVSRPPSPPVETSLPLEVRSGSEIAPGLTLLGADLQPGDVFDPPVGQLTAELYWYADSANLPEYLVAVRLVAADGTSVASVEESLTDGNYPLSTWREGDIVRDIHSLWIDASVPPGDYTLQVGLRDPSEQSVENWYDISPIQRASP